MKSIYPNLSLTDQIWSNLIKSDQLIRFDQIWSDLIRFDQIWSNTKKNDVFLFLFCVSLIVGIALNCELYCICFFFIDSKGCNVSVNLSGEVSTVFAKKQIIVVEYQPIFLLVVNSCGNNYEKKNKSSGLEKPAFYFHCCSIVLHGAFFL